MARPDELKWIEQGKALINTGMAAAYELHPFAISMLNYFYGANSVQVRAYMQGAEQISKQKEGRHQPFMHARAAVSNTIRELENGLVANLRTSIEGEVLGDFVSLAREALSLNSDEANNVAAVLTAAAFEDCLRRLATEKTGLVGRPKLEAVLGTLKDSGLIRGGNVSLANSMLKFRNDSLHADWQQVHRAQVESCLALTESLLREHFS